MVQAPRDRLVRDGPWDGGLVNAQPPGLLAPNELWRADDVRITERGAVQRRDPLRTLWADPLGRLLTARSAQVGDGAVVLSASVAADDATSFRVIDLVADGVLAGAGEATPTHDATQMGRVGEATDVWVPSFAQVGDLVYGCYRGGIAKRVVIENEMNASWQSVRLIGSNYSGVVAAYNDDYRSPKGVLRRRADVPVPLPGGPITAATGRNSDAYGLAARVTDTSVEFFVLHISVSGGSRFFHIYVIDADGSLLRAFDDINVGTDHALVPFSGALAWDQWNERLLVRTGPLTVREYQADGTYVGQRTLTGRGPAAQSFGLAVSETQIFLTEAYNNIIVFDKQTNAFDYVIDRVNHGDRMLYNPTLDRLVMNINGGQTIIVFRTTSIDNPERLSLESPTSDNIVIGNNFFDGMTLVGDRLYLIRGATRTIYAYSADDGTEQTTVGSTGAAFGAIPACDVIATYQRGDSQAMLAARGDTLRWSHPYAIDERTGPEDWAEDDHLLINPDDNDWITALIQYQDHLVVFKRRSTWILLGSSPASWRQVQASRRVGTISPNSTAQTPFGIAFYDPATRSLWLWDGASMTDLLKGRIRPAVNVNRTGAAFDRRVAVGYHDHEVYLSVPEATAQVTYVIDMTTGICVRRTHGFAGFTDIEGNTRDIFAAIPVGRPDTDTTLLAAIVDASGVRLPFSPDGADAYTPDPEQFSGHIASAVLGPPENVDIGGRWRNPIVQVMRDSDTPLADPWGPEWSISFGGGGEQLPTIEGETRIDHEPASVAEVALPGLGSLLLQEEGDNMGSGLSARFLATLPPGDDGHTFLTGCFFRFWPDARHR